MLIHGELSDSVYDEDSRSKRDANETVWKETSSMKRRIFSLLLAFMFVFSLALAEGTNHSAQELENAQGNDIIPHRLIGEDLAQDLTTGELAALMVRLFANILAGHIIIMVLMALIFIIGGMYGAGMGGVMSIVSIFMTIFMTALEMLVAYLQAYVFTILSSLFIGMAQHEPEHE